jgi:biofilm PGA synthesis N-glycosyltransferase PgaC
MRDHQTLRAALGPAFIGHERDLAADGTTGPGYVPAAGDAGPGRVVVIIAAHNEQALIGEALESVASQTRIVDEAIVVADRCSDRTSAIAREHGATVVQTTDNRHQKAGALNEVLDDLLPRLSDNDSVLVMDADTSLSPGFISEAALRLREPEGDGARIGGVGGIFFGSIRFTGFLGHLQNNEYVRYAREVGRRRGRADVLTGTATLFSASALRAVKRARSSGELPSGSGVYDVDALTEDNELTLALKRLGYRTVSPKACTVGTRLPATLRWLFYQRLRWQRGALENLVAYGATRETLPYVGRQLLTYVGVAFVPFYLTVLAYSLLTSGSVGLPLFWSIIAGLFVFERAWAVRRGGWRSVALSALIVPELVYDVFLHIVYIRAAVATATGEHETWAARTPARVSRRGPDSWRHWWDPVEGGFYVATAMALVVGLAFASIAAGIAWQVIGALVLGGSALTVLRLSGLDPLGFVLGSGENRLTAFDSLGFALVTGKKHHGRRVDGLSVREASELDTYQAGLHRQGFGGLDVPVDKVRAGIGSKARQRSLEGTVR